jgi:hypothetical protein
VPRLTAWSCAPPQMLPDLYFALTLVVKTAITAAFVVAATITAERAGPLVARLVATLSIGWGLAVLAARRHGVAV